MTFTKMGWTFQLRLFRLPAAALGCLRDDADVLVCLVSIGWWRSGFWHYERAKGASKTAARGFEFNLLTAEKLQIG